jgi:hypothetical protein
VITEKCICWRILNVKHHVPFPLYIGCGGGDKYLDTCKNNTFHMIFNIAAHQDHLRTLEERPNLQNIMNATLII